jgi:hypothetical protein
MNDVRKYQQDERRKHPRVANNVPLKICREDGDIITETGNISRSGAYCKVSKYIEPMTKLKTYLLLPVKRGSRKTTKKISCEGVVVRTESVPGQDYYNVAIFFNDISQKDADIIADYVTTYLEEQSQKVKL